MVWTETTRARYCRERGRYASDMSELEWAVIAPLLPEASRRGRRRRTPLRRIIDALLYMLWSGCPWRGLPRDFPPFTTIQYHFYRWRDQGWWARVNDRLVAWSRKLDGRDPNPSAVVIDSQSARTTESGGPRGFAGSSNIPSHGSAETDASQKITKPPLNPKKLGQHSHPSKLSQDKSPDIYESDSELGLSDCPLTQRDDCGLPTVRPEPGEGIW